jgi:hypothetical protein
VPLADASGDGIFGPDPLTGGETYYVGKAWCFGDLTLEPVEQDDEGNEGDNGPLVRGTGIACDGTGLDNTTQTDSVAGEISFTAVQARHNPDFMCGDEPPEIVECTEGQQYADAAGEFDQGTQKSGAAVLANRTDPSAAFGAPQTSGDDSDVGFPAGSFVSLGFHVPDGPPHGSLVLDFDDNVVVDLAGADLAIYETTGGVYPDESVKVEISQDGIDWELVTASATRDAELDISPTGLTWARYVRLTDVSDIADFPDDADAYDLDAIEALNCGVII